MALMQVYTLTAGKCQTCEALGKEGTKVTPEFASHVAFGTASLKHHPVQQGNKLLHFLEGIWLGCLHSAFHLFFCCTSAQNPKYLRKQSHASPLY